jgi:hypothetical protein
MKHDLKVIGYMPLLYGKCYLKQALMSMINHVDKMVILYTDRPSYGHGTTMVCPDTEYELKKIAIQVCGDKLIWDHVNVGTEGDHRGEIYKYTKGYDLVLTGDADEVFDEEMLEKALYEAYLSDKALLGISGYLNFWRSFNWVCHDTYTPIRIINLHNPLRVNNAANEGVVQCRIWHFSTAQPVELMQYKMAIHGHKNELRPNWLQDIFLGWDPSIPEKNLNLHSVALGLWNATPYDKTQMPASLHDHPFYDKLIIE